MTGYVINQGSGITWDVPVVARDYRYPAQECASFRVEVYRETLHQYEQEMAAFAEAQERDLAALRALYVFEDASAVELFLKDQRAVPGVLLEAAPHLKQYFGADTPLHLRVNFDEDGSRTLQSLAIWKGTLREAKAALARVDKAWWLRNCRRGSGNIIFDYELV